MRAFRNHVSLAVPNSACLISMANEERTHCSVDELGFSLAYEVENYIDDLKRSKQTISKITFVGHSLGGLIIRSALPRLSEYARLMHGYISLSTPHLGYMYNTNSIVNAGLWVLKRWKKSESLQQLSMSDSVDKSKTFIYKLS